MLEAIGGSRRYDSRLSASDLARWLGTWKFPSFIPLVLSIGACSLMVGEAKSHS